MTTPFRPLIVAFLVSAMAVSAVAQNSATTSVPTQAAPQFSPAPLTPTPQSNAEPAAAVQQLLDFKDSDVKFDLSNLMEVLRDHRHEGWVLAAYPDPKTSRPLIGAGFSLDLPERDHPQRDSMNPHPFIEPSSAQLWQAAGLDSQRLQKILDQFHDDMATWSKKRYRSKIKVLAPQITSQEATSLLRVSAIQAIYNARAYCRNFDAMTASQQMALSQLVYQMGVNLEEFDQFLTLINPGPVTASQPMDAGGSDAEHWKAVQQALIQSQWARLYRARAVSVIAMFDPQYLNDPRVAERQISATLHPAVVHRRRGRSASLRTVSYSGHTGKQVRKKAHAASKGSARHKA